jgi:hypothetical protein
VPQLSRLTFICSCLVVALVGCEAEPEPEPETFDPDVVIAEALAFEANFERLDLDGVVTKHDMTGATIARIWANEIGAEVFRSIDVTDPSQTLEVPRGAVFLKEHFDAQGNELDMMLVLAKFEEGYFPLYNDWFFALIERDGTPILGRIGNGSEVLYCGDCHTSMGGNTDLLIGLEADQQAP